ncbi:hypothetical protein M5X00_10510 [Paenibacillus alvei]|uniref:Lipoprotein n=2 Tax=Paenibacillus alvei TaxID=44250 RepID=A0ABT4H096_PAEAL|nr:MULTISPECIES: hypothetical protein [Paenibacillus]MBG9736890.1 hypothetical protein [Paenibacillus alvei]MBG9746411.1 hypothetical protein [Paenibacillus alvei]MCY7484614.1 hypothetical protein [Paenibacillus alvei]MCY9579264.1 hypothetical protein [Paenibacillus alvei]MCY9583720.1 hypothetical protein [Paenibacillus alvei]
MRNYKMLIILSTVCIFLVGCSNSDSKIAESRTKIGDTTIENTKKILSYAEYQTLFEALKSNLKISNFELKTGTFTSDLTIVDKDLTYNKRQYLTLNGELDTGEPKTTQELLIFENKNQSTQISIRIAYTQNYIGEDIIDWSMLTGLSNINEKLSEMSDIVTFSYKNIVFIIYQISETKKDIDITKETIRNIQNITSKY